MYPSASRSPAIVIPLSAPVVERSMLSLATIEPVLRLVSIPFKTTEPLAAEA